MPLANGQIAQQQTTTQYMFRAGPAANAGTDRGMMPGPSGVMTMKSQPPHGPMMSNHSSGGPMLGTLSRGDAMMGGQQSAGLMFTGQAPSNGGIIGRDGQQLGQYSSASPPMMGTNQPVPMSRGPSLPQSNTPASGMLPSYDLQSMYVNSNGSWGSLPRPHQVHQQPQSVSFQGNQQAMPGVMMGMPMAFTGPAMASANYQQQQQYVASNDGDKYAIFKAVDPRSPSLLTGKPPQHTQPMLHPNNGPNGASSGASSSQYYHHPQDGANSGSYRPL